jgi:hypothetical protein
VDRVVWGAAFETHLGFVFLVELLSDGSYLPAVELGDLD